MQNPKHTPKYSEIWAINEIIAGLSKNIQKDTSSILYFLSTEA